jgi:hypothetical protein
MKFISALVVFTLVNCYVLFMFWMGGVEVLARTGSAGGALLASNAIGAYVSVGLIMFWNDKR